MSVIWVGETNDQSPVFADETLKLVTPDVVPTYVKKLLELYILVPESTIDNEAAVIFKAAVVPS